MLYGPAMIKKPTVIAIGGHSLIDPASPPTVQNQFAVTARAVEPIVRLIEQGESLVLTHGNGPQVGFMQRRSELASSELHEVPLDSIVADTQGAIGYMLQRALREALMHRGIDREVLTLVTEVEVDHDDKAFEDPTKPIGRWYPKARAEEIAAKRGWTLLTDPKRGCRRLVPSPSPVRVVQLAAIARMAEQGAIVICCGGGGIPVTRDERGHLIGMEAVIDKDRASALLAIGLGSPRLVITTAVDAVYQDFDTDHAKRLPKLTISEVRALARAGQFPKGSMRPKMEAAVYFLNRGGEQAIICSPEQLPEALQSNAGTHILPD